MGGGQKPGVATDHHENKVSNQPGSTPNTAPTLPGPVGHFSGPVKPKSKSKPGASAAGLGIEVHEKSKISADGWLSHIKACQDVPDYFKKQIEVKGRLIFLTDPEHFRYPNNVIAKDWLNDWLSAFAVAEWELTTGNLVISVKKDGNIVGDLQPDLSNGEKIDGLTKYLALGERGRLDTFHVEYGDTLSDGITLAAGRQKLVVVADRVTLQLDTAGTKTFTPTNDEVVNSWFHEIACHAGRQTEGKPSVHGDHDVDATASDIDAMISNRQTNKNLSDAIQAFLK